MATLLKGQLIDFIAPQDNLYVDFFILIGGLIGYIINVVVFTSFRLFRGNQYVFYLTVESIANIAQITFNFPIQILIAAFAIDPTETSVIECKL